MGVGLLGGLVGLLGVFLKSLFILVRTYKLSASKFLLSTIFRWVMLGGLWFVGGRLGGRGFVGGRLGGLWFVGGRLGGLWFVGGRLGGLWFVGVV